LPFSECKHQVKSPTYVPICKLFRHNINGQGNPGSSISAFSFPAEVKTVFHLLHVNCMTRGASGPTHNPSSEKSSFELPVSRCWWFPYQSWQ